MDRNKRLLKTTIIYFIGTFGSKLLVFFLLPLYSTYLTTEQYGKINLVINLIPLIGPVFTLQITETIFRFLCTARKEDKKAYISNAIFIFLLGIVTFIVIYLPIMFITKFEYTYLFMLYFILNYFAMFLQQILRGMRKNIDYSITGILQTLVQACVNIFMIKVIYEKSILMSVIIASTIVIIYALFKTNLFKYLKAKLVSKKILKEMLVYSLPLIPNQISWWFNDIVGLYILKFFIGTSATGITSMSNKFPTMIATINSIFLLAWTENSIYEYNSSDKSKYYSESLQMFTVVIILISSLLLPAVKVYFELFINVQYQDSIGLVPIMFGAMIFNALASFLGTIYTASMKTKGAFITTAIAAISNIILAIILVPIINIYGYALANLVSYVIFYIARRKSVNKIVNITQNQKKFIIPMIIFIVTSLIYYITDYKINIIYEIFMVLIIFLIYVKQIKKIFFKILDKKYK